MPDATAFWAYFGVFSTLIMAGMGFPIPEEVPIVMGGVLSGHAAQDPESRLHWWIMLPVCIIGVVISDGILYCIGRFGGGSLIRIAWIRNRWLPPERLQKIENNFHKYGVKILLIARLLPAIRAPIFVTAGIMRLPLTMFLLADGVYAIPGVSLLFFLGYWFTDQVLEVVKKAESVRPLIMVVMLTAVVTYLVIHFFRRPVSTGAPEELEIPRVITQVTSQVTHLVTKRSDPGIHITTDQTPSSADGQAAPEGSEPAAKVIDADGPAPADKPPSAADQTGQASQPETNQQEMRP